MKISQDLATWLQISIKISRDLDAPYLFQVREYEPGYIHSVIIMNVDGATNVHSPLLRVALAEIINKKQLFILILVFVVLPKTKQRDEKPYLFIHLHHQGYSFQCCCKIAYFCMLRYSASSYKTQHELYRFTYIVD